ncbi:hypothetical protein G7046_g3786 [Stylonectria norvegica]|nr:hypothetical protein G7046_g3786 [Stylonectria norvegica]
MDANTPSLPPEYSLPPYDDDDELHHTPTGQSHAAVRLLTSVEEPLDMRTYVTEDSNLSPPENAPQTPLELPIHTPLSPLALNPAPMAESEVASILDQFDQEEVPDAKLPPTPTDPIRSILRRKPVSQSLSVKLQKKKKKLEQVTFADMPRDLPPIPEGAIDKSKNQKPQPPPHSQPPEYSYSYYVPAQEQGFKPDKHEEDRSSQEDIPSIRSPRRNLNYQPSVMSSHSRSNSILGDAPSMGPPDSTYTPFASRVGGSSPQRPWTPSSRMSDLSQSDLSMPPPTNLSYEPADLNGSPRPGTPSSRYGGSPRRPLPPAPLFSHSPRGSQIFADDATVSIPLQDDDDDVFGPESDLSEARPHPMDRHSYLSSVSQDTLGNEEHDSEYYDKVEH